jgi:hypothetical protein
MGFPRWPGESIPSLPHRPLLRFSIGYGSSSRRVFDYQLKYGLGQEAVADQVLLPNRHASPRLDMFMTANTYWKSIDNGWLRIQGDELFEVVDGRQPVIVISNIDTGDWQGGFRFGGVELRRVERAP